MNYDLKTPFTADQRAWLEDSITSMMMRFQLAEREARKAKLHAVAMLMKIRGEDEADT